MNGVIKFMEINFEPLIEHLEAVKYELKEDILDHGKAIYDLQKTVSELIDKISDK